MRRCLSLPLLALCALRLNAQPPAPGSPDDSADRALGCVHRPLGVPAQDSVALDSAGIRVIVGRSSPGARDDATTVRWCPTGTVVIALPQDTIILNAGRPFVADPAWPSRFVVLALRDDPTLAAQLDSAPTPALIARVNFTYPDWRAALVALAPTRLPAQVPTHCDGHPAGFAITTGTPSAGYTATRTEAMRVERGAVCLGVVTLASATRYRVHRRDCRSGVWQSLSPTYTSRAAAERAAAASPCVPFTGAR